MTRIKLPGLVRDVDRYGTVRFYYRQHCQKKIRIEGEPGTPAFLEAYRDAAAGKLPASTHPRRLPDTSFEWLCRAYFNSSAFKVEIGESWQNTQRRILLNLCKIMGHLPYRQIESRHIQNWIDSKSATPAAANDMLKALRALFKFAVKREIATLNPAEKISKLKVKTKGFHTWTVEEVRQFEARWPIGSKPRLAMALLLYTGLRRGDAIKLGRQHVTQGHFRIRTGKTGTDTDLPILPALREVLDATPSGQLTFLITSFGKPYVAAGFGNWFRECCDQAGLPHCSAHGLRKAGATIAAENGASDRELMAIYGWKNAEQANTYTARASQRKLAQSGLPLIDLRTEEERKLSNSETLLDNSAEKPNKIKAV